MDVKLGSRLMSTRPMSIATWIAADTTLYSSQIDDVDRFIYLGSAISSDGDATVDVNVRIGKAA